MKASAPGDLIAIRPIDRDEVAGSLHDEIYSALREGLARGEFLPGQTFSIRALAERFGTSVIPARDALKRLVAERALAVLPSRSFGVPPMSRVRFDELLLARLSLEGILAERAAGAIGAALLEELGAANDEMQRAVLADAPRDYLGANRRFHFAIYRSAPSETILPIVESLWLQAGPFLHGVFNATGIRSACDHHAQILKALARRDAAGAAAALRADIADAARVILARARFQFEESFIAA